ncbi:MAG: methyltransferase domain-containing protein [Chloroflexi bacterium]|nr:MAG: methyltransferase domain-containing protein [Chloroflexota bacterium]
MTWIILVVALVMIGFLLDREIYFYEGVHLGPRVQAWLYDRWSKKYDQSKHASQLRDDEMLAQPLLDHLKDVPEPFVLDFATGTGRLSHALISRPEFKGHIIALDLSQGMLEQAAVKLASTVGVELLRHQSLPLPFPDATFDLVCALEVLEHFPNMHEPLTELTRVLRPGGILLVSRGTEESGRKAKVKSKKDFGLLLMGYGFETFEISPWWKLYDRVIATKNGSTPRVGARDLSDVLRCPECHEAQWQKEERTLKCKNCGRKLLITKEGIVLN